MAEAKKYYWLKLKKDFFKRHDIQIIESMPNGKEYVLFYLKLLAESVSHNGELRFSETIPYNEQMLSTITNTNIDIVRSAVKIFQELELLNILDDNTVYMEEVNKMLGAETEWAKKKRDYRASQKQLEIGQCPNDVHPMSDKSKSKELEIELEKEKDNNSDKSLPLPQWSIDLSKKIFNKSGLKTDAKRINEGAKVINQINTIDGYDTNDIANAIEWALQDYEPGRMFNWQTQIQSPAGLRKKKNGSGDFTKFEKIYNQWKNKKVDDKPVNPYKRTEV